MEASIADPHGSYLRGFIVIGPWPVVWAALVVVLLVEIGFALTGRNPWWMQSRREQSASAEYRAPERGARGHLDGPA
jgi:hypothetical protein